MLPGAGDSWVLGHAEPSCHLCAPMQRATGGEDGVEGQELRSAWGQT